MMPQVPGVWKKSGVASYTFQPQGPGFGPGAMVTLTIPEKKNGPQSVSGSYLAHKERIRWVVRAGSVLRLQQLLAQEGYLPVSWHRAANSSRYMTPSYQYRAIYHPPAGTFRWRFAHLPRALDALWKPGTMNVITKGALMQFERVNGLTVDGIAGPKVWQALIADRLAGKMSPDGYTYLYVTESLPQTLALWVNGQWVLSTRANTGISLTPTYLGTFPIYERLPFQVMRGKDPNGTSYADPVHWINYFAGGDAVHGFFRTRYGFPQSLGCVEVPIATASEIYHQVHYGTLVTVEPPGALPARLPG